MAKTIVVLGGRLNVLEGARDAGVNVVLVHMPGRYDPVAEELCEEIVHLDFTDVDAVAEEVRRQQSRRQIHRIVSLTETGLLPAAILNDRFGLGGNPLAAVRRLVDKNAMRACLDDVGLSPVRYRVVSQLEDAVGFFREGPDGIVLKPPCGAASRDVHLIRTLDELRSAWRRLPHGGSLPVLAEELLTGTEISVESFSTRGRHVLMATSQKVLNDALVEVGHTMPATLTDEQLDQVASVTYRFLDAVGLHEGPAHTELMLTAAGPRVIESHNRIGGGKMSELVQHAYGVDLARLAVSVPLGVEDGPEYSPPVRGGAAIRFFTPEPGVVVDVTGTDAFDAAADLELDMPLRPGDEVTEIRDSFDRIFGSVMAWGADPRLAVERCQEVLHHITISTKSLTESGSRDVVV